MIHKHVLIVIDYHVRKRLVTLHSEMKGRLIRLKLSHRIVIDKDLLFKDIIFLN